MPYVLFVWKPSGWELREREGDPPAVGESLQEDELALVVSKVGSSPLPGDQRPCVYTVAA